MCFDSLGADGHQHKFDENADVVYDYTVLGLTRDKNNELSMLIKRSCISTSILHIHKYPPYSQVSSIFTSILHIHKYPPYPKRP
jgi:hypothetical protein